MEPSSQVIRPISVEQQVDILAEMVVIAAPPTETAPLVETVSRKAGRPRVVVTGVGAMTPLGESAAEFWSGLVEGRSGIGPMTLADPTAYPCKVAGEVRGFDPKNYLEHKEARRMARFAQFAVAAAGQAIASAGLNIASEDRERIGVLLGNGNGAYPTIDFEMRTIIQRGGMKVNPFFFPMSLPNMAASRIALRFGLEGYNSTICTACAASTQSIGEALEVIRRGDADVMLAGGAEAGISELGLAGFSVMRALATDNEPPELASRPFDVTRNGFVPSEGSGILVLETLEHALAREAIILCEVTGFGASADAYHLVAPEPDGRGAARAMTWAIRDAGLRVDEIDYISAHATSTPVGDLAETAAIKRVFGERAFTVPVSAAKSMIGHSLGAAGSLEALACVFSILEQRVHPTINLKNPDPECDLDYVAEGSRSLPLHHVLSNSFGFGGQNACLVFSKYELNS